MTAIETCANCDRPIGKLETPCLWDSRVVCGDCYARLNAPMAEVDVGAEIRKEVGSTLDYRSDRARMMKGVKPSVRPTTVSTTNTNGERMTALFTCVSVAVGMVGVWAHAQIGTWVYPFGAPVGVLGLICTVIGLLAFGMVRMLK